MLSRRFLRTACCPNPGYAVSSGSRPNPLTFPTLDAWNLGVQRSLTPTLSVTVAYVGNKGTHTLGDGDGNSTNPNEATNTLPGQYSVTGQTLHFNPRRAGTRIVNNWQSSTSKYLQRYYGGKLAACSDPNYISLPASQPLMAIPYLKPGMCGWTNGVAYRGDDQNTEFDAFQVTLAQAHEAMASP